MTHTLPISTTATPRNDTPELPRPTFGEILEVAMGLGGGLVAALLPLFLLSVPGVMLLIVLPAMLLLALAALPAVVGAVILAPPYLLVRRLRRRRQRTGSPPAGMGDRAPRAVRTSARPPVREHGLA
jgi:hypothetical protein